jgi:hypothetical protein
MAYNNRRHVRAPTFEDQQINQALLESLAADSSSNSPANVRPHLAATGLPGMLLLFESLHPILQILLLSTMTLGSWPLIKGIRDVLIVVLTADQFMDVVAALLSLGAVAFEVMILARLWAKEEEDVDPPRYSTIVGDGVSGSAALLVNPS